MQIDGKVSPVPNCLTAHARADPRLEVPIAQLLSVLTERGGGSVLRGWRRELDPDGSLDVGYQEFCRAASRLGCLYDYQDLFVDDNVLTLEEILPVEGALLNRFREWVKDSFGGPTQLFACFDKAGKGNITEDVFFAACEEFGFQASTTDIKELFQCCDADEAGSITPDEIIFLELDHEIRETAMLKQKMDWRNQQNKIMAEVYTQDGNVPATHRLARRPWLAEAFERLPSLVCQRREQRQQLLSRRTLEAKVIFIRHLRECYGTEVRAWRRGLDPHDQFAINLTTLRQYCRRVDINVDICALWKALDVDSDGLLTLEELCMPSADALAAFQFWAIQQYGSCSSVWDTPNAAQIRGRAHRGGLWASDKKMLIGAFSQALRVEGCPSVNDASVKNTLLSALDAHGCGLISREDLEWLDKWKPPLWLVTRPDKEAWEDIRSLMLRAHQHPLRAWRCLLDVDNSNQVSWHEFQRACFKLKFKGNIGGAWRHLDCDSSGTISMKEFDAPSAELLVSFKQWADENFGSVQRAFECLDTDGEGTLSFPALRKACRRLKWEGEVRLLFDCLDVDGEKDASGRRSLKLKDVCFLDSWEVHMSSEEKARQEAILANLKPRPQSAQDRASFTHFKQVPRCASAASRRRPLLDEVAADRRTSHTPKAPLRGVAGASVGTFPKAKLPSGHLTEAPSKEVRRRGVHRRCASSPGKQRLMRAYNCEDLALDLDRPRSRGSAARTAWPHFLAA